METELERRNRWIKMFGMSPEVAAEWLARAKDEIYEGTETEKTARIAQSLMSDAQEEISMGLKENARRHLNLAKWVLTPIAYASAIKNGGLK